jgi:uncharacterized membrane protein YgcG
MKKLFLMLAMLATFASCNQHKQTKLHSYVTTDDDGVLYWYMFYGQNNTYYTYNSRIPVTDFIDVAWNVSSSIPTPITTAKELPVTELEDNAVDEATEEAVDASPEAEANADADSGSEGDSGSDSGSGDSGGGDGGGDGGGGE